MTSDITPTPPMIAPKPNTAFGPYDLLDQVGQGGMAKVYKAKHRESDRIVAVKVAWKLQEANAVLAQRFQHEYSVGKTLKHPHLVRTLDNGVVDGLPYLAMEYVEGPSLDKYISHMGKLSEDEAVAIILQVADGLHYLHQKKIIHRDVKPGNILIGPNCQAKLADLGLIKSAESDERLTDTNCGLGTTFFAAPEQFENARNVDPRCDVYSLAGTLYMAVTGEYPFGKRGHMTILKRKIENDFVPPSEHVDQLSQRLVLAIRTAMRSELSLRPANCKEFVKLITGRKDFRLEESHKQACKSSAVIDLQGVNLPEPGKKKGRASSSNLDRRVTVRFRVDEVQLTCQALPAAKVGPWRGNVHDISTGGVCLRMFRRFEIGTMLQIDLPAKDSDMPLLCYIGRVRWVKEVSPRNWQVGCEFIRPLAQEEIDQILFDEAAHTQGVLVK